MRRLLMLVCIVTAMPEDIAAQQRGDSAFRFENARPAYAVNAGPVVCVDAAHHNFHTADGRYKPFAELLRSDGYRVVAFDTLFQHASLGSCAILVIANPDAPEETPWAFPHPPSFSRDEITELLAWVRDGGSLLLIVDHQPVPGVAGDLGAVLGAVMLDGVALPRPGRGPPHWFSTSDETLGSHPIVDGRDSTETVTRVATFTGHAFYPSRTLHALLIMAAAAEGYVDLEEHRIPEREWPRFAIEGWLQGAALEWGRGRVVLLGEAAMCTAQLAGRDRRPMGMNHPDAAENAQFCLNVVRWLDGVIDGETR